MSRSTSRLYHWEHSETPVSAVVGMIESLPAHIRPWAGRLVWWDRYAEQLDPVDGFELWLSDRTTPEPDPVELAQALVSLGYTPDFAGMRAGAQMWAGIQERRGRPAAEYRHAPEGTEFPVRVHDRIGIHRSEYRTRRAIVYTVRINFTQAKRPQPPIRKAFSDYFSAMDYALDWKGKIE